MKLENITVLIFLLLANAFSARTQNEVSPVFTSPKTVLVPEGNSDLVSIDGFFSDGEWDDAASFSVKDNYNIYFKADSEILCIGLKSPKQIGELVCEVRFTTDAKDIYLLHVSGALGEGRSGFPATQEFDLNNNILWEANYLKADSLKNEEWIAAGRPLENYDDIYNKRDGIEFKIRRSKIAANALKLIIGWIRVEVTGQDIDKRTYNFPDNVSIQNADNWVELILPD